MNPAIPDYRVRHSQKSRSLRLKVTRDEGLCVVVPIGFDEKQIPAILRRKKDWIAEAVVRIGETRRFLEPQPATHLPNSLKLDALGETWSVAYVRDIRRAGVKLRCDGEGSLVVSGMAFDRAGVIPRLKEWLRLRVRTDLRPTAEALAKRHQLQFRRLLVKSQRTRWASCSAQRNLSLNTKLLFLRPDLVRYVLLHELCHTVHMNHSREFWRLLASCEPRFKQLDLELRTAWKHVPQWMF